MSTIILRLARRAWLGGVMVTAMAASARAQGAAASAPPPDPCTGKPMCESVTEFAATITDFRTSVAGYDRLVSAVVRFENRTTHPLTLGYVFQSGIVTDDQGNRYIVTGNGLRGMGQIVGTSIDPKFVLQPGESSDARFEFGWRPGGQQIIGTTFEMDLAIREIEPLPGNQVRLGKEHALHFDKLGGGSAAAPAPAPVASGAPSGGASAAGAGTHAKTASAQAPPADSAAANAVKAVSGLVDALRGKKKTTKP